MRLSILIPTLRQRSALLDRLMGIVEPQLTSEVEVLLESDSGEAEIGTKRNTLMARARGDYVCYVDDDDRVAGDYVSRILGATEAKPDCVGIEGVWTSGAIQRKFVHSIKNPRWSEDGEVLLRPPNHLNPVLRSIARLVRFPEKSWGEDESYSMSLLPNLVSEVFLEQPIYFYDHNPDHPRRKGAGTPPVAS